MNATDRPSDDDFGQRLGVALRALPDAPVAWQDSAIALWRTRTGMPAATPVRDALRRLVAQLSFDSWAAPAPAFGMRSLQSQTRHLLFSTDGRDIDLRIAPAGDAFTLAGQILGPDETADIALASVDGSAVHAAALDALGEFHIDGVQRGRYRLTLRTCELEIELPSIAFGEPTPGEPVAPA